MFNIRFSDYIGELADNRIAFKASCAAIELDNFVLWKEGRKEKHSLDFANSRQLAEGLKAVLDSAPKDADYMLFQRSGLYAISGAVPLMGSANACKLVRQRVQSWADRLGFLTENSDIHDVIRLRDLCIVISRSSLPHEGIAIKRWEYEKW